MKTPDFASSETICTPEERSYCVDMLRNAASADHNEFLAKPFRYWAAAALLAGIDNGNWPLAHSGRAYLRDWAASGNPDYNPIPIGRLAEFEWSSRTHRFLRAHYGDGAS